MKLRPNGNGELELELLCWSGWKFASAGTPSQVGINIRIHSHIRGVKRIAARGQSRPSCGKSLVAQRLLAAAQTRLELKCTGKRLVSYCRAPHRTATRRLPHRLSITNLEASRLLQAPLCSRAPIGFQDREVGESISWAESIVRCSRSQGDLRAHQPDEL